MQKIHVCDIGEHPLETEAKIHPNHNLDVSHQVVQLLSHQLPLGFICLRFLSDLVGLLRSELEAARVRSCLKWRAMELYSWCRVVTNMRPLCVAAAC